MYGEPDATMSEYTRSSSFQILIINSRLKQDALLWSGAQLPKGGDPYVASVRYRERRRWVRHHSSSGSRPD